MAATGHAVSVGAGRAPGRAVSGGGRTSGEASAERARTPNGPPGAPEAARSRAPAADRSSGGALPAPAESRVSSPPDWLRRIHPATWLLALFLLFLPAFANDFIQLQVFGWAFVLGMIALSLMFLAGYGGMVSLVQMTVAGCAGYMYAIFGHSAFMEISLGWPWWATIPVPCSSRCSSGPSPGRWRCGPRGSTRS